MMLSFPKARDIFTNGTILWLILNAIHVTLFVLVSQGHISGVSIWFFGPEFVCHLVLFFYYDRTRNLQGWILSGIFLMNASYGLLRIWFTQ